MVGDGAYDVPLVNRLIFDYTFSQFRVFRQPFQPAARISQRQALANSLLC